MTNVEGYDEIKQSLDNLKEETEKWLKANFEQWRDQSMTSISQGDLTYVLKKKIDIAQYVMHIQTNLRLK